MEAKISRVSLTKEQIMPTLQQRKDSQLYRLKVRKTDSQHKEKVFIKRRYMGYRLFCLYYPGNYFKIEGR